MTQSLAVLCGGRSGEHEVSLMSAKGIMGALDRSRFAPLLLVIDKAGGWRAGSVEGLLLDADDPARIRLNPEAPAVVPVASEGRVRLLPPPGGDPVAEIEVVLPIIHGTDGEDGALQGMLRMWDVPFVGADVLGSAVGMDKDVMKRLLSLADMPVARWQTLRQRPGPGAFAELSAALGLPLFVKPANLGSSVAVNKVEDEAGFAAAMDEAFSYDRKVLVEEAVSGRELEVSVLGADDSDVFPLKASRPGEIIPRQGFYSYAAKYLDENGAELVIPADVTDEQEQRLRELAVRAFTALECEGMARVDFFLAADGRVMVNEINTLPGFTPISMYPKLWEVTGLPYPQLLTTLVDLALERQARRAELRRDFR